MANALTLRIQKADAMARVVRTTFALTLCVRMADALTLRVRMADALTLHVRMSDALTLRVRKADGVVCVVRSDLCTDMHRPGAEYLASLRPERPERLLRPDAAPASGRRIFFLMHCVTFSAYLRCDHHYCYKLCLLIFLLGGWCLFY